LSEDAIDVRHHHIGKKYVGASPADEFDGGRAIVMRNRVKAAAIPLIYCRF
jgi:hypothetical protein